MARARNYREIAGSARGKYIREPWPGFLLVAGPGFAAINPEHPWVKEGLSRLALQPSGNAQKAVMLTAGVQDSGDPTLSRVMLRTARQKGSARRKLVRLSRQKQN
jgi:hypothetical protein